ncbi:hypothetical protein MMC13_000992 [Lambiella insularis]|nr:hypothetical protein [Lambiella insularis]
MVPLNVHPSPEAPTQQRPSTTTANPAPNTSDAASAAANGAPPPAASNMNQHAAITPVPTATPFSMDTIPRLSHPLMFYTPPSPRLQPAEPARPTVQEPRLLYPYYGEERILARWLTKEEQEEEEIFVKENFERDFVVGA